MAMKTRRQARESALQALYSCDTLDNWTTEQVALYFNSFIFEESIEEIKDENKDFAEILIKGVLENLDMLDTQISAASENWSLSRMSRVDRNILRLATYEIIYLSDIPNSVSINEAIEIAKRFGNDDSPMFINGVLDKIASGAAGNISITSPAESIKKAAIG